ncbi:hypothetical protein [Aeoliella sp. SH292]|uniref:hypothetical protein n=1 Tax=Aeoliella sp. SH292 TaxID=3454464 RepID=UPI003F9A27CC
MIRPFALVSFASVQFALAMLIIASFGACRPVAGEEIDDSNVRLKQVVAYTSGVAFFERAGEVEGDVDLVLRFPDDSMNDLLKSLVLLDLDGGKTATVTYENRRKLTRAEGALPLELSYNTLADILQQLSGQRVMIGEWQGRIVSIENEQRFSDSTSSTIEQYIVVQSEEGLMRLPLSTLPPIKLEDSKVQAQFDKAVAQLATSSAVPTKQVKLQFRGEGKRRVRIGYLQEFPMWKVSYRLVMDDDNDNEDGDKMLLQGWGLIENTTRDDWDAVELSLVSGQPFAFRMNLYEPLYVARPEAPVSVAAGVMPRVYAGPIQAPRPQPGGIGGGMLGGGMGGAMGGGGGLGGGYFGGEFGGQGERQSQDLSRQLANSQATVAQTADVGELFHYTIDRPVSLASDTSAMLPIVNANVKGEKLSLFDPLVNESHSMHAVRLTNTTDLHLMRGPITVLADGGYAGDARLADTPPDAERLVTYAMDSEVDVTMTTKPGEEKLVNVGLENGSVVTTYRTERTIEYRLRNESDEPRKVVIQRVLQQEWKVTHPDVTETKDNAARFELEVPAGETLTAMVVEQQEREAVTALELLADDDLTLYIQSPMTDEATKQSLEKELARRQQALEARMTINLLEAELRTLVDDQNRIGKALQQLERGSALYNRYIEKLDQQETQIEERRKKLESLRGHPAEKLDQEQADDLFGP